MKRILIQSLLIGILIISCKDKESNSITVKGTISNARGEIITLKRINENNFTPIDSTLIAEDGTFELYGNASIPSFYSLDFSLANNINLIIRPGEVVIITAEKNNLRNTYKVEGSEDSKLIRELDEKFNYYYSELKILNNRYESSLYIGDHSNIEKVRQELDSIFEVLRIGYKEYIMDFIDKNLASLASFSALFQAISNQEYLLDPYEDYDYFRKVDSALTVNYPNSEVTRFMNESMVQINEQRKYMEQKKKQLSLGAMAPEISLLSPDGDTLSLSSLKGKYVLLDFWASWCPPCRQENPNLLKIFMRFSRKGFTIFQVSLDRDKTSWIDAIRDDQLGQWYHVSDLQFWNSVVVPVYAIKEIPANYLLDKDGRILAKNLRGDILEYTLNDIFSK